MDYEKEINRLCDELKWDPVYPCSECPRKDEEFCSNRKCLETLHCLSWIDRGKSQYYRRKDADIQG